MSIFLERKSIRKYQKDFKIPRNELNALLEIAMRAPSSMNLQPTRLFVADTDEAKEKIRPLLMSNEMQLETASAFIIIFTDLNKYTKAEKIFTNSVFLEIMPESVKSSQLEKISHLSKTVSQTKILHDGLIDGGLFAMNLMLVAKNAGYDTCPIGGFHKNEINDALNISKDLFPVLMISIGKAAESGYPSYRLPLSDTITYL